MLKALQGRGQQRAAELAVDGLSARQISLSLGILRGQGLVYCERMKGTNYQIWWAK